MNPAAGGPDDGSDVPGILHAVQREQAGAGSRLWLQIQHRGDALRCFGIADGAENMVRKDIPGDVCLF